MQFIKEYRFQIIKSILVLLCIVLSHFPFIDQLAEDYTEQGIKRTLLTYAVSRSLNGVISVAQGTEVAVSPVGVGLTFTPGEILDPVNDLVERFSWVVLASGTSLGMQRVFLEMSSAPLMNWFVTGLGVLLIFLICFYRPVDNASSHVVASGIIRLFAIFIILRFSIPVFAFINEVIYIEFLQDRYQTAQTELENAGSKINATSVNHKELDEADSGFIEKASGWLTAKKQDFDIETQLESVKNTADMISQQVINMIVVFILQTLVFPLLFLWVTFRLLLFSLYGFKR